MATMKLDTPAKLNDTITTATTTPARMNSTSPTSTARRTSTVRRRHSLLEVAFDMAKVGLHHHHREEEDISGSNFMFLKDEISVEEGLRSANDGEVHSANSSEAGLRKIIGISIGTGAVEAVLSALEPVPTAILRRKSILKLKNMVKSIIFVQRLNEKGLGGDLLRRRRVSFNSVILRDYEMTLGDQVCRQGYPVSLGWEYSEYKPTPIDEFELNHPERRPMRLLRITAEKRAFYLLYNCEIPRSELDKARKANVMEMRMRKSSLVAVDRANAKAMKKRRKKSGEKTGESCCRVS